MTYKTQTNSRSSSTSSIAIVVVTPDFGLTGFERINQPEGAGLNGAMIAFLRLYLETFDLSIDLTFGRWIKLANTGYGTDTALRGNITALGLSYVAGILPQTSVWTPGTGPRPPKKWSGNGRPPKLLRRDSKHRPISAKKLAIGLPSRAWHKITWREGTAERLSSRFARVRVRPAPRDYWRAESRPEE